MNEKFVFYNKWVSYLMIGFLGPLVSGLGQWINEGTWPPNINWIAILGGCIIGAATQNLSFFSTAYGKLMNGKTPVQPTPPTT